ncbi:unnamed protein product [Orchesella dallaii]|uniref:Uncharacterized protein n=1 Tax=Orchesella dallaii TaxID=48710 RepID=A0ABP1PPC9_9HEXA
MKVFSSGLIVLLVAVVGSVVGGVCICMYFYQEGKRKRQVRPEDEQVAVMTEKFDTKKLWERGRKKPITLVDETPSVNPSTGPPSPSPAATVVEVT